MPTKKLAIIVWMDNSQTELYLQSFHKVNETTYQITYPEGDVETLSGEVTSVSWKFNESYAAAHGFSDITEIKLSGAYPSIESFIQKWMKK